MLGILMGAFSVQADVRDCLLTTYSYFIKGPCYLVTCMASLTQRELVSAGHLLDLTAST